MSKFNKRKGKIELRKKYKIECPESNNNGQTIEITSLVVDDPGLDYEAVVQETGQVIRFGDESYFSECLKEVKEKKGSKKKDAE